MQYPKFDTWLARQFAGGLVDLRLSVRPAKGICAAALRSELLCAEAALQAGVVRAAPVATSSVPEWVRRIIECTTLVGEPAQTLRG